MTCPEVQAPRLVLRGAAGGSGRLADLGRLPGVPGCPPVSADPGMLWCQSRLGYLGCSAPWAPPALVGGPGWVPRGWQRHRKEAVLTRGLFLAPACSVPAPVLSAQRGHPHRGRACRAPGEARGTGSVTDCLLPGWSLRLQLVEPSAWPSWHLARGLARPKRDQTQPDSEV